MKLQRHVDVSLEIREVPAEVYDVFRMTGFTKILGVRRRMREVSVEGLEIIGQGANGVVYRLGDEEVVKAYRPWRTLEEIEAEREATKEAFLLGVPCAIPFDTVRTGDGLGTIFELIDARSVVEAVTEDPDGLEAWGARLGALLAEVHAIEVPENTRFNYACAMIVHDRIDRVRDYFTADEIETVHEIMGAIPDGHTFVHGDFHPANIMVSDGSLMLVDLDCAGYGHPLVDLLHTRLFMGYAGNEFNTKPEDTLSFVGLTFQDLKRMWKSLLVAYVGDERAAARLDAQMEPYMWLSGLTFMLGHGNYHEWLREKNVSLVRAYLANPDQFQGMDFPTRRVN